MLPSYILPPDPSDDDASDVDSPAFPSSTPSGMTPAKAAVLSGVAPSSDQPSDADAIEGGRGTPILPRTNNSSPSPTVVSLKAHRVRQCYLTEDQIWQTRAMYLPGGSTGLLLRKYTDAQCIYFLCNHLLHHFNLTTINDPYMDYELRTPFHLHTLLVELSDSLVRVAGMNAGTLDLQESNQLLDMVCLMLVHPEPLVRSFILDFLKDSHILHFVLSASPSLHLKFLNLLHTIWYNDELQSCRKDVVEIWEGLYTNILFGKHSLSGKPPANMDWSIKRLFEHLIKTISILLTSTSILPDAAQIEGAASAPPPTSLTAAMLTLKSDTDEEEKLHLLRLLSQMLEISSTSRHIKSNHDLIFYLLLESLKHPQMPSVQRGIMRLLHHLTIDYKLLKHLTPNSTAGTYQTMDLSAGLNDFLNVVALYTDSTDNLTHNISQQLLYALETAPTTGGLGLPSLPKSRRGSRSVPAGRHGPAESMDGFGNLFDSEGRLVSTGLGPGQSANFKDGSHMRRMTGQFDPMNPNASPIATPFFGSSSTASSTAFTAQELQDSALLELDLLNSEVGSSSTFQPSSGLRSGLEKLARFNPTIQVPQRRRPSIMVAGVEGSPILQSPTGEIVDAMGIPMDIATGSDGTTPIVLNLTGSSPDGSPVGLNILTEQLLNQQPPAVRDLFASSTAAFQTILRNRARLARKLRQILRVPGTFLTLDRAPEDEQPRLTEGSDSALFGSSSTPDSTVLNQSGGVKAMLPSSMVGSSSRVILSILTPSFPGVPKNATTIPQVMLPPKDSDAEALQQFELEARQKDGPTSEVIEEEDEEEEDEMDEEGEDDEDEEEGRPGRKKKRQQLTRAELAERKRQVGLKLCVPDGYVITNNDLSLEVPERMVKEAPSGRPRSARAQAPSWSDRQAQVPPGFLPQPYHRTKTSHSPAKPLQPHRFAGEIPLIPDAHGQKTLSKTMLPLLSSNEGLRREIDSYQQRLEAEAKEKAKRKPAKSSDDDESETEEQIEPEPPGPKDFFIGTTIRMEVIREKDDAGQMIESELRETLTYECVVRDIHRSILATPMSVQDQLANVTSGSTTLAIGSSFMLQVNDKQFTSVFWDVSCEVLKIFNDQEFIRSVMAPEKSELDEEEEEEEPIEVKPTFSEPPEDEDEDARRMRLDEAELRAIDDQASDGPSPKKKKKKGKSTTPIPAGVTELGIPFYYPPVNVAPMPVGIDEDGRPIYQLPPRIKPIPAGYTVDGQPYYESSIPGLKDSPLASPLLRSHNAFGEVMGYTRLGVPFCKPVGAHLPQPSGYTAQGIPYYEAPALLKFMEEAEKGQASATPTTTTDSPEESHLPLALPREKEKPFFRALISKRRLRFISEGWSMTANRTPYDLSRSLIEQFKEREEMEQKRRDRIEQNEDDGLIEKDEDIDRALDVNPDVHQRLPSVLLETFKFNLISLAKESDKGSGKEDESPPPSPGLLHVKPVVRRKSSRSSLRSPAAFNEVQRSKLKFLVSAIPAKWFSVYPQEVDLSAPGSSNVSPDITVAFDSSHCTPSSQVEGKLVLRWDDGTLLAHCPIQARIGPFINFTQAESEVDSWCAIGSTRTIKFILSNLTDSAVNINMSILDHSEDVLAWRAERDRTIKAGQSFTTMPPKEQYTLENLGDEAFELPGGGSRVIHVLFAPVREGFFEALVTCLACGIESIQIPIGGVGGLPVAFQILQGNLKVKAPSKDSPMIQAQMGKESDIDQLKRETSLSKLSGRPRKLSLGTGRVHSLLGLEEHPSSTSDEEDGWSSATTDNESEDEEVSHAPVGALKSTIMALDLSRHATPSQQDVNITDVAQALKEAESGPSRTPEQLAKEERRLKRLKRKPKYRPLSASHMSYFQESLDKGGREHFVDFGIIDADSPTQLRAIDMQNLLSYKVVIVVACRSAHFDVKTKFHEVPAKGSSKIPVTFKPKPGMDGLVSGTLEVFWQDSTHTLFHLQAFVGQPLIFNLAPRAYFAPCCIGDDRNIQAVAYNRSPYHLTWDCTPFGPPNSLAHQSFRHIHRSRSQEGMREETENDLLTEQQPAPVPFQERKPSLMVASSRTRRLGLTGESLLTQITSKPYSNSFIHLIFSCSARGIVTAPLGIRLLLPHRQDYWACRTHSVLLVGIGLQPSYTLPLSLLDQSNEEKRKEESENEAEEILKLEADRASSSASNEQPGASRPPTSTRRTPSIPSAALLARATTPVLFNMDDALQIQLLNHCNLDFGGSDLRSDLARLQQWLLGLTNSVAAAMSGMPSAVRGQAASYKSRLKRKRFTMSPHTITLLGRWKPGDREDESAKREITAMWQLLALANTEPEDFVVLRTPGLTVNPWQGTLSSETSASSSNMANRKIMPDGTMVIPGTIVFHPAPGPTEFTVFEGFIMAVSLLDKHYISIPVHSERSHGVLISPDKSLTFPRVIVDTKETEYILLRSRMLAPVNWTLTFPSSSGFNSFVVPVRSGRLEPAETEVVKINFEPNAQGHYKEVCEINIHDLQTGELVLTKELLFTGTGHSPHIAGFPTSLDFGNVPLGWMGFVWVHLTNHGFVDDEVHLFAPTPFMTSDTFVRIRAKSTARVGFFFCPHKSATVKKTFTILAGGKVVRISAKGRGGVVKLQCKSKEPEGAIIKTEAPPEPSGFPNTKTNLQRQASIADSDTTKCHIHFGTAQMETLVKADLHIINDGSLPVRLAGVTLNSEFMMLSEGVFSNTSMKQVEISTKANRWAMISKQKTGVAMAITALEDEVEDQPTDLSPLRGSMDRRPSQTHSRRESALIRPSSSMNAGSIAQVVKEAFAGRSKRSTKRGTFVASESLNEAAQLNHTPVLMVPPGHTLRLKIEFRPRREQEFDTLLLMPYSEDPTQPLALFEEDTEEAKIAAIERKQLKKQQQKSGIAVSMNETDDPFSTLENTKQKETEVGYLDLSSITPELALYFAFMRRRETDNTESEVVAEQLGVPLEHLISSASSSSDEVSAPEQAIIDAYKSIGLEQLREMAYETDLYTTLMPRALTDPNAACLAGSLSVRMSGGCYGSISIAPTSVNFGPVAAGRFLISTNRSNIHSQLLAYRTSTKRRPAEVAGGPPSLARKASLMLAGKGRGSITKPGGGWATRKQRPSIMSPGEAILEEDASSYATPPSNVDLIPGLLPSELNSTLAAEEDQRIHPAFEMLSNGIFPLAVHNGSIHAQTLKLEYIKPACFSLIKHASDTNVWDMRSGQDLTLQLAFEPHETNTVYMGVAVFSHLFGTLTIPLRGVGASAHVHILGLQSADSTSLLAGLDSTKPPAATPSAKPSLIEGSSDSKPSEETKEASVGVPRVERANSLRPATGVHPQEAPLGSFSKPLGGRWTLRFPPVKLHTLASQTFTLKNQGLLPSRYIITCSTVPFSLEDPNTKKDVNVIQGVLDSNESIKVKATCLLFVKQKESYAGEMLIKWQLVPRGIWVEERVELSAKIGKPLLTTDKSLLNFGSVVLNRPSLRKFTLKNTGDAILEWEAQEFEEGTMRECCEIVPRSGTIRPGCSCVCRVLFQPAELEFLNSTLHILSDGGEVTVALQGSVLIPQLNVPELSKNFGIVRVGAPQTYSIELYNSGSTALNYLIQLDEEAHVSGAGAADEGEQMTLLDRIREVSEILHDELLAKQSRLGPDYEASAGAYVTDMVEDVLSEVDGLKHIDSLSPENFDARRRRQETQILSKGGKLADPKKPLLFQAFSAFPWNSVLMPRSGTIVDITVNPKEIGVNYVVRVVVAPGIIVNEKIAISSPTSTIKSVREREPQFITKESFQSLDLHAGVLACIGGGADLSLHIHLDREKFNSWESDLGIDPTSLLLPGIIPLGLIMSIASSNSNSSVTPKSTQAVPNVTTPVLKSSRTISLKNTGNLPGSFVIEPIGGSNERLERTLMKEQSKVGGKLPLTQGQPDKPDDTVFTITPLTGTIQPGETLWLNCSVTSTTMGFLQQQFRILSPDSSSLRENFTLLAYGGETKLDFVQPAAPPSPSIALDGPGLDFGVSQIGVPVTRYAILKNSGNQNLSFTAELVHIGRNSNWREVKKLERQNTNTKGRRGKLSPKASDEPSIQIPSPVEQLTLPEQSPFNLMFPKTHVYKVPPHSETKIEIQYLPSDDGIRDQGELRLDWLGPSMVLPIYGAAGTGALDVVYTELEAQQLNQPGFSAMITTTTDPTSANTPVLPPVQFGLCLVNQTHWRTITIRNVGTLDMEFRIRVSNPDLVAFKTSHISSATHAHRILAKRSIELSIGMTPTLLSPVGATLTIISSIGEMSVPLGITGGRFICDYTTELHFGEVAVEARVSQTLRMKNAGDLPTEFKFEIGADLKDFIAIPRAKIKRAATIAPPSAFSLVVPTLASIAASKTNNDDSNGLWETIHCDEIDSHGNVIPKTAPGYKDTNRSRRTMQALTAINRASTIMGDPSTPHPNMPSDGLMAALRPHKQYFLPLKLELKPGDVAEVTVDFLSMEEVVTRGVIMIQPVLPGISPLEVIVKARSAQLKISLNDLSDVNVGKVMLNHVTTVVRTLQNHTKHSHLKFRLEFKHLGQPTPVSTPRAGASQDLSSPKSKRASMEFGVTQVWTATPMMGTLAPNTNLDIAIAYNSIDQDESNWHPVQIRLLNVTQGTVDGVINCQGSVSFPRLSMFPLELTSNSVDHSRPTTPRRATSPLMEENDPTLASLGLISRQQSLVKPQAPNMMTAKNAAERYFEFGVRAVGQKHFRSFGARNDGTGSITFTTKITLTKRTHALHMVEVNKEKGERKVSFIVDPKSKPTTPATESSKGAKKSILSSTGTLELSPARPFFLVANPTSTVELFGGIIEEKSPSEFYVGFRPLFEGDYHAVLILESEAGTETIHLRGRGSSFAFSKSLSISQELIPPAAVLDFGVLFLGQEHSRTIVFENLVADYNSIWMLFEEEAAKEDREVFNDLMRVWSECMSIQGRLQIEDIYHLTTVLQRMLQEERTKKLAPAPTAEASRRSSTRALAAALAALKMEDDAPTIKVMEPDEPELKPSDVTNTGDIVVSIPLTLPTERKVKKKKKHKPTVERLMSVDVAESSSEEEEEVDEPLLDPAAVAALEAERASALLTSRAEQASIALSKRAELQARLESLWTRREAGGQGAFSFFPEAIFLGPGAEAAKAKAAAEKILDEKERRRKEEKAKEDQVDRIEAGQDPKAVAEEEVPLSPRSLLNTTSLPSLAQLAPSSVFSFSFRVNPPIEYEPLPPELLKARLAMLPQESEPGSGQLVMENEDSLDKRLPLFKKMLSIGSVDPAGKPYERTILVRSLSRTFPLHLRARFAIYPVHVSRTSINFQKTVTNSSIFRRVTITNPAPYNIPFRVVSNHECFTCEPSVGFITPESSIELIVKFFSSEPIDTHDLTTTPTPPTIRIHTLDGVLEPHAITCHCICTDYIFSTKLFKDIDFGTVFVKTSCEGSIHLANVTDGDVDYHLTYEKFENYRPITINLADQAGIVKRDQTKKVVVRFDPNEECEVDMTVGIETKAGTFNIRVTGRAVIPTIELSQHQINFGVVGVGYTVERFVTVTNTCALPLRIFAKPTELDEDELDKPGPVEPMISPRPSRVVLITHGGATTKTQLDAEAAIVPSKPFSFLVDLPKTGIVIAPNATHEMKIHYAPVSTPVLTSGHVAASSNPNPIPPIDENAEPSASSDGITMPDAAPQGSSDESSSASSTVIPSNAQGWEFPIDHLTIPFYAEGRDTRVGCIKCLGKGGLMFLSYSHHNIEFGNIPKDATRRDEVVVTNRGDVPVVISISAIDSEITTSDLDGRPGRLRIESMTDHSATIQLAPGEERIIGIEFRATGEGGEFHLPFRINLLGTTTAKSWHFSVGGFVDDIRLSGNMENYLREENLESLQPCEVGDNIHLPQVLQPVDYVASVSVHHELARVEPLLALPNMSNSLSIPSALAPGVLMTFKRWYFDRLPLRMTVHTDKFTELQNMLADKTIVQHE